MQNITIKHKQPKKRKKRLKCYQCLHSSRFDSDWNELPSGYVYCRKWQTIQTCGFARIYEFFELDKPVKGKFGKKSKRRW